jgi:hypothetical protein
MSIQEPPAYGRPEPTAHQRVDLGYSAIRALIMSLVAGIAIGVFIHPGHPDRINPDPIPREQAADAYLCGVIGDEERVQREILHDGDAVRSPEYDTSQRRTEAYLCGEIANEERMQRQIFHDEGSIPLPECDPLQWRAETNKKEGETSGGTESLAERSRHFLVSFFGQSRGGLV